MRCIDGQNGGPRLCHDGSGLAVDLTGLGLSRVTRDAREPVPLQAVGFGPDERAGDAARVRGTRVRALQCGGHEILSHRQRESGLTHRLAFLSLPSAYAARGRGDRRRRSEVSAQVSGATV